jgi:hypothetical protein
MRWTARFLLVLVLGLAAAGALIVVRQDTHAGIVGSDFTVDYAAGVLLREGRFADMYDQPVVTKTLRAVVPDATIDPRLPFNHPLASAIPDALLSLLPIGTAFRLWQFLSAALLIGSIGLLQRRFPLGSKAWWLGSLVALAAVPTWASLTEGQVTPMVLSGAALLLYVAASESGSMSTMVLAGAAGALLAVKPQYLPLYLLILIATRRRNALLAAVAGGAAMLMSPLLGGATALGGMLNNALLVDALVPLRSDETWMGVLSPLLPVTLTVLIGLLLFITVLLSLSWIAWRRSLEPMAFALVAGILAVLASPHALPQDLLILGVPAWLTVYALTFRRWLLPLAAWLGVDLALVLDLRGLGFPIAPLVLTALLGWLIWRLRQQAAWQAHRPPIALAG